MALIDMINSAAASAGLPPSVLSALVAQESGTPGELGTGNPNALGKAGEIGLTQLMPSTANSLGVNPYDPAQNLQGGADYLAKLTKQYGGNLQAALSAYNSGSPDSPAGISYANKVLAAAGVKDAGTGSPGGAIQQAPSPTPTTTTSWTFYIIAIVVVVALVLFGLAGVIRSQ